MKGILFILFICLSLHSKTLEVSSPKLSFKLDYTSKKINLESMHSKVEVNKVKCNEEAFDLFITKFNQKIKKKVLLANADKAINIKHKNKSYAINPNSSLGQYLAIMHESVFALKVQEWQNCE